MKEFVEKMIDELLELIILLPSGGILFVSIVWLWLDADIMPTSVQSLFGDSSTALVVMLIATSALGLLMFAWAAEGADAYLESVGRPRRWALESVGRPRRWAVRLFHWALESVGRPRRWAVRLFHWMPIPFVLRSPRVQAALHSMANDYTEVEAFGHPEHDESDPNRDIQSGRSESALSPWRSIARFRLLVNQLRPRTYAFSPKGGARCAIVR